MGTQQIAYKLSNLSHFKWAFTKSHQTIKTLQMDTLNHI